MCGIVGYAPFAPQREAFAAFGRLFDESRVRGTHAYGLAFQGEQGLCIAKSFDWRDIPPLFEPARPTIAHTRYCQSGDWQVMANNQPIVVGNMALAHNGVISQATKEEFEQAFNVVCTTENDSEIFLQRLKQGQDAGAFIDEITGSFAAVWLQGGKLWAGRNSRRPLWVCVAHGAVWYASTKDIFVRAEFEGAVEVAPNAVRVS